LIYYVLFNKLSIEQ